MRPTNLPGDPDIVSGGGKPLARRSVNITEADLGLTKPLAWNHSFHIQPRQYHEHYTPEPPKTYGEALKRQNRLLHGQERRRCCKMLKVRA